MPIATYVHYDAGGAILSIGIAPGAGSISLKLSEAQVRLLITQLQAVLERLEETKQHG